MKEFKKEQDHEKKQQKQLRDQKTLWDSIWQELEFNWEAEKDK